MVDSFSTNHADLLNTGVCSMNEINATSIIEYRKAIKKAL